MGSNMVPDRAPESVTSLESIAHQLPEKSTIKWISIFSFPSISKMDSCTYICLFILNTMYIQLGPNIDFKFLKSDKM